MSESYPGFGGQACCILEICCGGPKQVAAMAQFLEEVAGLPKPQAQKAAEELCEYFDFATKGTLAPFKNDIIKYVLAYTDEVRAYHQP